MTADCGKVRRILWPEMGPRDTTPEVIEARAHVAGCASCTRFFEDMEKIRDGLKARAPRPIAPLEVRDRLFKSISLERTRVSVRRVPRAGLLVAGVAAAVILLLLAIRMPFASHVSTVSPLTIALAEEHAQTQGDAGIASSSASDIEHWINGKVSFAVHVPSFAEASLKAARIIQVQDRTGVVIEYSLGGEPVSYFILSGHPAATATSLHLEDTAWNGYRIVSWAEEGLLHAFVGNVPRAKLKMLARECIEQAGMTVALGAGQN